MEYLVVKDGDTFLLTDPNGNILPDSEKGLYTRDTRFLDTYVMSFNHNPLVLLHSSCHKDYISEIYLTNQEEVEDGVQKLHRECIEVKREQLIRDGVFYERTTFYNYARMNVPAHLEIEVGSRFSDLLEVRGIKRTAWGTHYDPIVSGQQVEFGYMGLDKVERRLRVHSAAPSLITDHSISVDTVLTPGTPFVFEVSVEPVIEGVPGRVTSFSSALQELESDYATWMESGTKVTTDNPLFDEMIHRGLVDLRALLIDLGHGELPAAGIPWFAVPYGRDSIITSLQMLHFHPEVAKGTLLTLASLQGTEVNVWRAEQPGKILHETRSGEIINLGELPFKRYYGSIDSTPLFLILAVEYYKLTKDEALITAILPNIMRAIAWLDQYADVDGDGLVEYHAEGGKGLSVQSWKDSHDSMLHEDGETSMSPMAVSEVQGYVYHAKFGLSKLLPSFGHADLADRLRREAVELKLLFNERFWVEDKNYFAIALDKDKKQVRTVTSDPGQCLWSDIIEEEHVEAVVDKLFSPGLFSGWGIRTMSSDESIYSPISYHNGSVWAHDNSLILLGLAKQGKPDAVNRLSTALYMAAQQFEYKRLPELFCGHDASCGSIIRYPVACIPQAWAAGTPLVVLQSILGLRVDTQAKRIYLSPTWPEFVNRIEVRDMLVQGELVSFSIDKAQGIVSYDLHEFVLEITK